MLPWWLFSNPKIDLNKAKKKKFNVLIDKEKFPHICPECGSPAFIGLNHVSCSNQECDNFDN